MAQTTEIPRVLKIIGYWAVTQLNYRQPKGEWALARLRELTDPDVVQALMFITGFCLTGLEEKPLRELAKFVEKDAALKGIWNVEITEVDVQEARKELLEKLEERHEKQNSAKPGWEGEIHGRSEHSN